jgi:hypothetical protein
MLENASVIPNRAAISAISFLFVLVHHRVFPVCPSGVSVVITGRLLNGAGLEQLSVVQ